MQSLFQVKTVWNGLSGDREAVILYGLGFPEFDDALNYSTIKWNNNGLRTNKNDACTVDKKACELPVIFPPKEKKNEIKS